MEQSRNKFSAKTYMSRLALMLAHHMRLWIQMHMMMRPKMIACTWMFDLLGTQTESMYYTLSVSAQLGFMCMKIKPVSSGLHVRANRSQHTHPHTHTYVRWIFYACICGCVFGLPTFLSS